MALLEVDDLSVTFSTPDGLLNAVRGISFSVDRGETLGIVGESGSGKSVSTQTIAGLTQNARVSGQALFDGQDLLRMTPSELQKVRGEQIGMIFQDPLSSLHPYYKVGKQITEMIHAHEKVSNRDARKRAVELLALVGIPQPDRRFDEYPHQFSGGMRQRAMIAMAMALNPVLLIADEPTTALDVTVQAQVLDVMANLQKEFGTAIVLITHDLGVVADVADNVMVMYAGRAVEKADRSTTYYASHHPYTRGLLASLPSATVRGDRLKPIPGQPPSLIDLPTGCSFHTRCTYVMDRCVSEVPQLRPVGTTEGHASACWLPETAVGDGEEIEEIRRDAVRAGRRNAGAEAFDAVKQELDGTVAGAGAE